MQRYTSIQHERRIKGIPPPEVLNSPTKDEMPHKIPGSRPVSGEQQQQQQRTPPIPAKKDSKPFFLAGLCILYNKTMQNQKPVPASLPANGCLCQRLMQALQA